MRYAMQLGLVVFTFLAVTPVVFGQGTNDKTAAPAVSLITVEELKARFTNNQAVTVIDVRNSEGYARSDKRIKGALHIKLRRLRSRLSMPPLKNVPRDQEIVTYCACPSEHSSIAAAQILLSNGFKNVRALKGGWFEWLKVSGQVEPRPKG
jgi:rhodanese-related sulfurtransferase